MQAKLIVLEGIDGSGKTTQFSRLCGKLEDDGIKFEKLIFPRYDKPSSSLVKMYLGGELSESPYEINPFAASTFYAVDRYASYITDWRGSYNRGALLLADRFTSSNAVHQGSKLYGEEMLRFFDWLYDFEFNLLELPKPDLVIYLDLDVETAISHMTKRQNATKTTGDIHETNADYLKNCLRAGRAAADYFGWKTVNCIEASMMRPVEDISNDIIRLVLEEI